MAMTYPYEIQLAFTIHGHPRVETMAVRAYNVSDAFSQAGLILMGRLTPDERDGVKQLRVISIGPPLPAITDADAIMRQTRDFIAQMMDPKASAPSIPRAATKSKKP